MNALHRSVDVVKAPFRAIRSRKRHHPHNSLDGAPVEEEEQSPGTEHEDDIEAGSSPARLAVRSHSLVMQHQASNSATDLANFSRILSDAGGHGDQSDLVTAALGSHSLGDSLELAESRPSTPRRWKTSLQRKRATMHVVPIASSDAVHRHPGDVLPKAHKREVKSRTTEGCMYLAPCERLVRSAGSEDEKLWPEDYLLNESDAAHTPTMSPAMLPLSLSSLDSSGASTGPDIPRKPSPSKHQKPVHDDFVINDRCKKFANFLSSIEFGVRAHDCQPVTYKTIPNLKLARNELAALKLLTSLRNPHIMPLLHSFRDQESGHLVLVLPRLKPFNVADNAHDLRVAVRGVLRGLMRALETVHAAGWVHLDINANNLLRGDSGQIVLIDFGLARPLAEFSKAGDIPASNSSSVEPMRYFPRCGTPGYIAPEVARGTALDPVCDVFSAGVVFAQAVAMYLPDRSEELSVLGARRASPQQVTDTARSVFMEIITDGQSAEPDCVKRACECVAGMLDADPTKRWTVLRVLEWCDEVEKHGNETPGWWVSLEETLLEKRRAREELQRRYSNHESEEHGGGYYGGLW